MPLLKQDYYTIQDIYALPDGQRAELIDGEIYDMTSPKPFHQELLMELSATLRKYINRKMDYSKKNALYAESGVREYWIVDPDKQRTTIYRYE